MLEVVVENEVVQAGIETKMLVDAEPCCGGGESK